MNVIIFSVVTHPWISFSFLFLTLFNLDPFYWHVLKLAEFSPGVSILHLNSLCDFNFFLIYVIDLIVLKFPVGSSLCLLFFLASTVHFFSLNVNCVFLCLLECFYNSCLKCVFDNSKLPFLFILVCFPPSVCYCLIFWDFRYVFYSDFVATLRKGDRVM